MALDVYFREDLANVIRSVDMGGGGTTALVHEMAQRGAGNDELIEALRIYRRGYKDALAAVAQAFGITPTTYALEPGPAPVESMQFCVPPWEA